MGKTTQVNWQSSCTLKLSASVTWQTCWIEGVLGQSGVPLTKGWVVFFTGFSFQDQVFKKSFDRWSQRKGGFHLSQNTLLIPTQPATLPPLLPWAVVRSWALIFHLLDGVKLQLCSPASNNSGCASGVATQQVISLVNAAKRGIDTGFLQGRAVKSNGRYKFKLCHLVCFWLTPTFSLF